MERFYYIIDPVNMGQIWKGEEAKEVGDYDKKKILSNLFFYFSISS